ncbi:MAG: hypothetical protein SAJ12_13650 [Jaaginema sp. PMC 1079.18]|nr:hypothetical protein [Jaaginema sp. PMC 1080.18]MEC4852027.1 hypothetical protein [Jaaginema sp. PMC 1079.18]MEC4865775.1 hypothetical protein [Jaaginema sp. PMC 1078.18]
MQIVICPGIHPPELTRAFLVGLNWCSPVENNVWVYPADTKPAYSGGDITQFVRRHISLSESILWIGFSAGVVGAITAAWQWQHQGGRVKGLIALDGWGMPLGGDFPIYRMSHDYFTHWSSALLGGGETSFYADPGVEHLTLWNSPHQVWGWQETPAGRSRITAAIAIQQWLEDLTQR